MKNLTTTPQNAKKTYSQPEVKVFGQVKNLTLDAGSDTADVNGLMGMAMM
ncbi:hypothetical protein P1X15_25360 [Runella sp. MFBS21]|nr:hypothetical protein [Runella sp. MFBS21]MDF7820976.1 hypothetical protein [Runella sp. MFBS21]